ncbi:glucosamine 6-phosphate synthetase-like amidotransferase/phosphosugar isomerase protein [Streptosporangium album]|uniref:Glutamine--fructose-6-phosphate aminotransferase [isomerizing] n=1 Tax=Streptosporangium album TaxID=47479 RepID=A0A7W7RY69_9ACTN|nr:SIS domain-containing protein [Streptosporangium album]MBB4940325.1 glucosamine 6-phosphate synthetase-like amidotransferase/phosphosugar isomerase protein [Streptosporangium album]
MDPELYLADLEAKPSALAGLASALETDDPFDGIPAGIRRVVFLGMGSSRYAAGVAALRLRAVGVDAVAEYASASISSPATPDTLVVAVSATGGSRETLDAVARHHGRSFVLALTNRPGSAITEGADLVVPILAGEERGGVSCRTFQHTLGLLLALRNRLTGAGGTASGVSGTGLDAPGLDVPGLLRRTAEATADLLDRRSQWLEEAMTLLDGPAGVYTIAPAERLSSAQQSALMFREGPRRAADACETGDWSHVDVYLTKTLDYRAILFPGSRYDSQAMDWIGERGSTVLTVGGELPGARAAVRYLHDDDPGVALLTETLVAELVAAQWWLAQRT